ncbi:hypothetical protein SKAU_G00311170 [Synaphobranchus kaupii]|uniref:Uncharacterized protein n=1 Tax=Synaphobranchus kaupii TaxID=118154 RepID=A0A9Q1ERW1_SYNKA|nr:hypothetical protein SKAU_G00311170 [Synaphobranchus kaupii]
MVCPDTCSTQSVTQHRQVKDTWASSSPDFLSPGAALALSSASGTHSHVHSSVSCCHRAVSTVNLRDVNRTPQTPSYGKGVGAAPLPDTSRSSRMGVRSVWNHMLFFRARVIGVVKLQPDRAKSGQHLCRPALYIRGERPFCTKLEMIIGT